MSGAANLILVPSATRWSRDQKMEALGTRIGLFRTQVSQNRVTSGYEIKARGNTDVGTLWLVKASCIVENRFIMNENI